MDYKYPNSFPITLGIAKHYIPNFYTPYDERRIEIMCTLGTREILRARVTEFVTNYTIEHNLYGTESVITEEILGNKLGHYGARSYYRSMQQAKIIITAGRSIDEDSSRLWESLASGALVFTDPIYTPYPHPLKNLVHVVFYNSSDKSSLWEKLDYYRRNQLEARIIALNGYLHAMKFHQTVNFVDYAFRSAHLQTMADLFQANPKNQSLSKEYEKVLQYTDTAQDALKEAEKIWAKIDAIVPDPFADTLREVNSIISSHPNVSPREGSAISEKDQVDKILTCRKQANCTVPYLQLRKIFKVYQCKRHIKAGYRFNFLVREGIRMHPNIVEGKYCNRIS